ncbi:MAG: metallophosphoesterase [Deltaproteobacteria bacterium]|nr:metallophosphoesterase [Deltaproteobacteria bacterium]
MRPAEQRAQLDIEVGRAQIACAGVEVAEGLAAVRALEPGRLALWGQAPALDLQIELGQDAPLDWRLEVANCMPGALLRVLGPDGSPVEARLAGRPRAAAQDWEIAFPAAGRYALSLAPPDADEPEAFRFAVLSDIQRGVDRVAEIFERMNADPEIRFVVSTGDLANFGTRGELERIQRELERLEVPFFSTVGNHELGEGEPADWHALFGRHSFRFRFHGVRFYLVDSASAGIDQLVYDRLAGWMAEAGTAPQVFVSHIPPLDPIGVRNGSFRSRKEAAKLLSRLSAGGVDLTLYGHIHSYYAFSNAGIPAHISGGGGAIPERFDGIGRHYLVIEAAESGLGAVEVVRVD